MVGVRLRSSWRLLALAPLIGVAVLAWRPAEAIDTGVGAPAPAGTVWRIVGGYNTGTHYGIDPYAIDIVREDFETAGTLVLAPIRGVISWRDASCLTINDGTGNAILICHMFPADTATVGTQVRRGDYLGTVAPAGYAENNGLSHLHLAVHRTLGAGQIQESLPFAGPYALEGVSLVASAEPNAYGDYVFTSTTVVPPPVETQPAAAAPPQQTEPAPAPAAEPVVASLQPGWNLVGWTVDALVDDAIAPIVGSVDAVFAYDGPTQSFLRYDPAAPPAFNSLAALPAGAAAFVHVDADSALDWALPASPTDLSVGLSPGFNLVSWMGGPSSILDATADLGDALIAVHAWDAGAQRYQSFRPNLPPELNALAALQPGQALWIELATAATWNQTGGSAEATDGAPAQSTDDDIPVTGDETPPPDEETTATDGGAGANVAWVRGPGCLNLRTVPTVLDNTPITCVDAGTQVTLLGPTANDENGALWRQTQVGAVSGWMFAFYLHLGEDPNAEGGVIGDATYYHPSLAGQPLYCGGVYDPGDATMVAATSWGCGTRLRIWAGGAYIDVVVRDTGLLGPFHVDLSEAGFAQLAPLGEGRIEVRIEVLEPVA